MTRAGSIIAKVKAVLDTATRSVSLRDLVAKYPDVNKTTLKAALITLHRKGYTEIVKQGGGRTPTEYKKK